MADVDNLGSETHTWEGSCGPRPLRPSVLIPGLRFQASRRGHETPGPTLLPVPSSSPGAVSLHPAPAPGPGAPSSSVGPTLSPGTEMGSLTHLA